MITSYDDFINETHNTQKEYAVGDVVLVRYYLTGDITPVKIIDKPSKNYYMVSHDVIGSHIGNAPNMGLKSSQIISKVNSSGLVLPTLNTSPTVPNMNITSNDLHL